MQSSLSLVDIRTLDHLVVASNGVVSLKERGYMNS
ncbi:JAB domain-containing protein [Aeromonas hydrophila]